MTFSNCRGGALCVVMLQLIGAGSAGAQSAPAREARAAYVDSLLPPEDSSRSDEQVDSLVVVALAANPTLRAAELRLDAAQARIASAGALPDPIVGAGIMNMPVSAPGYDEMMTMNALMVGQRLPFPGKLSRARQSAELEAAAAAARLDALRLDVIADVRTAYFELAFLDRSLEVLGTNRTLLVTLMQVTESRYAVGRGGQQDLLRANVEAARIAEEAVALREARRAALARLNALLDRNGETPVRDPRVPERMARAAVHADASRVRFTSDELGARAAGSPIPPLRTMQETAVRNSPMLRAHDASIAAQAARVDLARRAHLPDFDVSVQYGQRPGHRDLASIMITVPVPVRRASRQAQQVIEAEAELMALQADRDAAANGLRTDVAQVHAELERTRTQLALFVHSIIPQGRAALESATTAFQVDRADFLTVLDNETTLFNYEIAYHRALSDFAKGVAELERLVGAEVLP